MRVLQTIPYMLASQGGPSTCTCNLLKGLYEVNGNVDLLTSHPQEGSEEVVLGADAPWIKTVACDYKTTLALSKNVNGYLKDTAYDVYHANTLWLYPVHATCSYARKMGKPYVLSPHGMLYPTALAISAWKKKVIRKIWFDEDIMKATCIHATCKQEAEYVRAFGYKGPIAVIPNAVVFPEYVKSLHNDVDGSVRKKKTLGFLGRLHPIKKIENIIYALSHIADETRKGICFQIMGKYDEQYEQWLKVEVERLGLSDCVEFLGFVSGKDKYDRLAELSALMVPSAQENFGMIVPEALICGTPVYASLGTPWSELNEFNAGWWADNSPESITKVILDIIAKSDSKLKAMGANGSKLMEEKYEQHKVAQMMIDLYKWIGGEGERPEFVYMDKIQ